MIRTLIAATLPAVAIVAAAALFLVVVPIRVQAAECTRMVASWYGAESGNRTANGERFDGSSLTAAHKTLPFGTRLKVSYQGKSVVVRINDRGPWIEGRSLDLSTAAAKKLGMIPEGVVRVCVDLIK